MAPAGNPVENGSFGAAPDGLKVEEILVKYQVEWQLWAMVVKHFADPAYHSAYLSHVVSMRSFDRAAERYREHRAVMMLGQDHHWQADVADLMLERIQTISLVCLENEARGIRAPEWLQLLPWNSSTMRIGWITLGLLGMAKFMGLV